MKYTLSVGTVVFAALAALQGCSSTPKSPDVAGSIQDGIKRTGLKDVSVSQDREKGVVTLKGSVTTESDKASAESLAKSMAGGQVVANEIAVLPPGVESETKTVYSDLDGGIKKNLDAALIEHGLHDNVSFDVRNGVVILTGEVNSDGARTAAQRIAMTVPNVQQVVNKLDIKHQQATSTK